MSSRWSLRSFLVAASLIGCLVGVSGRASAQNRVEAPHKGAIGLGLLGAELGFTIPSAFGYTKTWSLITLPIVGAGGGAVAGYYLDRAGSPAASVSVLVLSLAFAVPTVMITVNATRYSTSDLEHDTSSRRVDPRPYAGRGLIRRYGGEWHLAMPGLALARVLRVTTDARVLSGGPSVQVTLFSGAF